MSDPASRTPLSDTQKRLLLYGPPLLAVGAVLLSIWFFERPSDLDKDQDWTQIDYAAMPEVDLLRRYLRIDTSPTTGSELAGAEFLAAELAALGLEPTIERLGENGANVWAILEGKSREALVLHSHIDVFPIREPERWNFDPFAAQIDAAWLYGRGVFDMKSVAIVQLLALKSLVESRHRPEKSVIFLATGSEEVGSELGTRWILDQHPELAERFWTVLTEGGIVEPISRREIKYWGIEFAQKRFAAGYFCSRSKEQLLELRARLIENNEHSRAPIITPETRRFFQDYGESRDRDLYRDALLTPENLLARPNDLSQLPPYLRAMFRNEIAAFEPEPDPGGGFRLKVVVHLLPGQSLADALKTLVPEWLSHGIPFQIAEPLGADHGSPPDHPVLQALGEAVRSVYAEAPVGTYFLPWSATDSRFFRQEGIDSYGFSPFVVFSTDTFRVDGPNERMSLPGYMSGFEIYRRAVANIAG
ncbi:MAG: M20/M25/M40 family metallo-hydrolase [Acidobacteria bacterium]|nr:M20/M25/M40 family metallo-hydrolase [Acidobacteriota bacterium]